MASSGSFSGSIHSGHYVLRVDWTQTKNVSANTSTITANIYLVNDWSLSISGRSDNSVTIDGTAQTFASPSIGSTGTHLLGTVSQTVNHASDGSKSLTISAVFNIQGHTKRHLLWFHYSQCHNHAGFHTEGLLGIRCFRNHGIGHNDCDQPGIFFLYPYADLHIQEVPRVR